MSVLMRIFIVLFIVFLFAPIFLLPIFAFNDSAVIALPLSGFTTRWFGDLLQNAQLQQATFNSLRIALTVAVLATTLAFWRRAPRRATIFAAKQLSLA